MLNEIADRMKRLGFVTLLLVACTVALAVLTQRFLSPLNLMNVARNASVLMIVSYGQMLVMIVGGFDLSIGAVAALASVCGAMAMAAAGGATCTGTGCTGSMVLGLVASVGVGVAVGFGNGAAVVRGRVAPFMATLSSMFIGFGIAFYLTNGVPVYGVPQSLADVVGRGAIERVPYSFCIAAIVGAAIFIVQRRFRIGRYLLAIGSNATAASATGINVSRVRLLAYSSSGLFAAIAGILITARLGSGQANIGANLMIQSTAAAVLGGVSLRGGSGKVEKVVMGSVFMAVVENGLNLLRIESKLQTMAMGIVLLVAVIADQLTAQRASHA